MLPIMKMPAKYCSKMVLLKWPAAINSTANLHRGRLIQLPQQAQQDSLCGPPLVRSPFENPNRLPAGAAAAAIAAQLSQQQQQQQQSTSQQQPTAQSNAEETPSAAPSAAASASTTETQEASPQESTAAAPAQTSETPREEKDGAEQQQQQQKEEAGGADEPPTEQQNQEEAAKVSGFVQRQFKAAYIGLFVIGGIVITGVVYVFCIADPPRDPVTGQELRDKYSDDWWPRFSRFLDFLRFSKDLLVEPSRDKLLPDPVKPPWHQPKYTVVLEIRNVLVSPQWNYKNGHYFVKRPALDYFMEVVGYPNFELVIYTSENMSNGHLIQQIDPKGHRVNHALFRDCTKYMASKKSWLGGVHVKDLSRLNRDLKRVIYIDWEPEAFQLNPDNVLRVPKWQGDMNDTFLVDLAELLKTIHLSDVDDVRPVLQFYSQFDNPMAEFRRRAKMLVQEEQPTQTQQQQQSSATAATPTSSAQEDPLKKYRGNLFGARRHAV